MKNKKGFTLIELLAVIALLAILSLLVLPAVLKTFRNSKVKIFENEIKNVYSIVKNKYIIDDATLEYNGNILYTNICDKVNYYDSIKELDLSGNSNFKYYFLVDIDGKIIDIRATDGTYSYVKTSTTNNIKLKDINVTEENEIELDTNIIESMCYKTFGDKYVSYIDRKNKYKITVGDEVAIGSEHFYVISSDSNETVLLAKYNLLVGDVYEQVNGSWARTKTLSESDTGYGLQSEIAKGYNTVDSTRRIGTVAFSGKGYWDNANCLTTSTGGTNCSDTSGLKSEYVNSANAEGKTGTYSLPYPYVYRSNMSNIEQSIVTHNNGNNLYGWANDNGYTIAYYVERYVNALKKLGAPNNIIGRLLNYEEVQDLSSSIKGNSSYWLGSAYDHRRIRFVYGGSLASINSWVDYGTGVRPVVVVKTNDIEEDISMLLSGEQLNIIFKNLANPGVSGITKLTVDTNITAIKRYKNVPTSKILSKAVKISTEDSANYIYAWYESGTIYYYCKSKKIYMNQDSSKTFMLLNSLTTIDFNGIDTSKVTNMNYMFFGDVSLTVLDLNGWNTTNVTNMSSMFRYCTSLVTIDLTTFDTSNVTNMQAMFLDCLSLSSLDLSNFNTTKVTDMSYMFAVNGSTYTKGGRSSLISLNLSSFDTSNVTTMLSMFQFCELLTSINVSNFNIYGDTNLDAMFISCKNINIIINIHNNPTIYNNAFKDVATIDGSNIVVNYNNSTSNIDNIIATKSSNSNVTKGSLFHDIIYNSNEGSRCENTFIMNGESVTTLCVPTRKNYTFDGWYTDNETFTNKINTGYIPNNNVNVYAKWISN